MKTPVLLLVLLVVLHCAWLNGIKWTKRNPTITVTNLDSIAYGNGKYVMVGNAESPTVVSTPDLAADPATWDVVTLPPETGSNVGWFISFNEQTNSFVIVGGQNPTFTSTDAINWQFHSNSNELYLDKVVYGNGLFISVPLDGAYIYYSIDAGMTWNYTKIPGAYFNIVGATFANGMFLVYGADGTGTGSIYGSTDAVMWTLYSNISQVITDPIVQIDSVSQGPGSTLIATVDVRGYGVIVISGPNGKGWQKVYQLASGYDFGSTSYWNGVYYAEVYSVPTGEMLLTSLNGQQWSKVSSSVLPSTPHRVQDYLVVVGDRGYIQYSADGQKWTIINEGIVDYLNQFLFDRKKEQFYLTFQNTEFTAGGILGSQDGISWKVISNQQVGSIIWVDSLNMWAADNGQTIYLSQDMVTWTAIQGPSLPSPPDGGSILVNGFAYGNGIWVIVYNVRTQFLPTGYLVFTAAGPYPSSSSSWKSSISSSQLLSELGGVAFGGGVFLLETAPASFGLFSSTNGMNWTAVGSPGNGISGAKYYGPPQGPGQWVYFANFGVYDVSTDRGVTWTNFNRLSQYHYLSSLNSLPIGPSGQSQFFASATDGTLWTSDVLITQRWQPIDDELLGGSGASGVYYSSKSGGFYVSVQTFNNNIFTGQ